MDRLPRDAQRLLDAARNAADPLPAERAQADAAARSALAQHGVTDLPALDAPIAAQTAASATATGGSGAGLALKLGVAGAAALAALLALQALPRSAPAPEPPLPVPPPAPAAAEPAEPERPTAVPQQVPAATAPVDAEPEPARTHARRARPSVQVADDSALQAELRLIADANALLQAGRFEPALGVLDEHARRYPAGALRVERAALRVLALCGEEPTSAALRERERFLRAAPGSLLAARVRAACSDRSAENP